MFNFLHNFQPQSIIFTLGPIIVHWYGFIITGGVVIGFLVSQQLAKQYGFKKDQILDFYFWLIVFGLVGARLYHVLSEYQYYWQNPLEIVKIWNGGLGIYGGVVAGVVVVLVYSKKIWTEMSRERNKNLSFIPSTSLGADIYHLSFNNVFWLLLDILTPALILGQAIGRWGNYFNQEIFGLPTRLPWGIPIEPLFRPEAYRGFDFFHPTFLYQSVVNFAIFGVLIFLHHLRFKRQAIQASSVKQSSNQVKNLSFIPLASSGSGKTNNQESKLSIINYQLSGTIFLTYLILYSLSRFFLEFLRLDVQPIILGLRLGQWVSGVLFLVGAGLAAARLRQRREIGA